MGIGDWGQGRQGRQGGRGRQGGIDFLANHSAPAKRRAIANSTQHSALNTQHSTLTTI
ncbi:hypothetical protein ACQFX9_08930 [Aliinostoc sp. HNIBRCY26]|uniref:hypothetical protein n=1 Tax=Aliinostoc sp. HNIBRCY26 TaxID=3418997 RepID=UPI003D032782